MHQHLTTLLLLVSLATPGTQSPVPADVLQGDFFLVAPGEGFASGEAGTKDG